MMVGETDGRNLDHEHDRQPTNQLLSPNAGTACWAVCRLVNHTSKQ